MWKMRLDSFAFTGCDCGQRSSLMGAIHLRSAGGASLAVFFVALDVALDGALVALSGRTRPAGCWVTVPGADGAALAAGAAVIDGAGVDPLGSAATNGSGSSLVVVAAVAVVAVDAAVPAKPAG